MVIQIETAQNGFVVRDTKQEDASPVIVENFNNLVSVLVQVFNVQLTNPEGDAEATATQGLSTAEASEADESEPVLEPA